jgi:uncharacterized membrane protein
VAFLAAFLAAFLGAAFLVAFFAAFLGAAFFAAFLGAAFFVAFFTAMTNMVWFCEAKSRTIFLSNNKKINISINSEFHSRTWQLYDVQNACNRFHPMLWPINFCEINIE